MPWVYVSRFEGGEEELSWRYKKEVVNNEQQSLTCVIGITSCVHNWKFVVLKELQNLVAAVVRSVVQQEHMVLSPPWPQVVQVPD